MGAFSLLFQLVRMMFDPPLRVRRDSLVGFGTESLAILLSVAGPYLLKLVVDQFSQPVPPPAGLILLLLVFAIATGATGVSAAIRYHSTTRIVEVLTGKVTQDVLRSALPGLAQTADDGGPLFAQIERLPSNLQILIDGILWQVVPLLIQMAISLGVILAVVPWHYATLIGLILFFYLTVSLIGADSYQQQAETANARAADLSAALADILRNAPRVVFNGNVSAELADLSARGNARLQAVAMGARALGVMSVIQSAILVLGLAALLGLAANDVLTQRLTTGDFVLLHAYVLRLTLPLGGFGFLVRQTGGTLAQVSELLVLAQAHEPSSLSSRAVVQGPGTLRLTNIGFGYGQGRPVVRDVNASIGAGGFTVLAGANGSGKSTLARIMAGLLDPADGNVFVNDLCLAQVRADERHRYVLYVPQQIGLFNRTLRDNGLYPPTNLDSPRLLRLLLAFRFYDNGRVPDLDGPAGGQGRGLSGGQAQKLELARLAGVEAPVIILDETTSALDPASELILVDTLRRECAHSTLVLITHRRVIAERADQVLFMSDGALLFSGTHHVLMREAAYRGFWRGVSQDKADGRPAAQASEASK
ncbi:ABC transporter ATP-binding protein [Sphingobium sp. AN558]|uniref:ATP-binding cassette domain-containing protein n=1 Tax=Sphingobium sp. AN558 TaxID=3133442 RepID=UPI0030C0A1A6